MHDVMLSCIMFVCTGTTFYAASIGEVRFGGTFRISDLQDVGLWSDFEILAENFEKNISLNPFLRE